jgi:hypothetical protein
MVWTAPRTWTAGENVTKAIMDTHVRDNLIFLRAFHGARLWESAALSQTATGANQLVTWDTEDYDTDAIASIATDDFVIPSGFDGYYRIETSIEFAGNATGQRRLRILKNETYTVRAPNVVGTLLSTTQVQPPGANALSFVAEWTGPLVAGDRITIEAFQSSGGNLALGVGQATTWTECHYLGN